MALFGGFKSEPTRCALFAAAWSYNDAGLVSQMRYPGGSQGQLGEVVTYTYLPQQALNTITGEFARVTGSSYDALGRLRLRYLGSSTHMVTAREYHPWSSGGRLYRLGAGNLDTQQAFFYLQYSYDLVGNITGIDDQANPSLTQRFTYDELDRLVTASATGSGSYSESYSYDVNGRLATKAGVTYAYNSGHYHAVSGLSNGNAYGYDANGNMTARSVGGVSYALEYDADNHLTRQGAVNQDGYRYVYDGDGSLIVKIDEASGARSVYLGSYAEVTDGETAQPTPTASATPSPTITRTPVLTRTPTASPTLSRTPTKSATPTRTTAPTGTPIATYTATRHAGTRTATNPVYTAIVHTATPTNQTRTVTRTWTPSRTPTKTKTPTNPPTNTLTPSNTPTPTLTPTPTQSLTPTASPNPNLVGMKWTFYYLAGNERVAMRVVDGGSNQLYYLFTDHLGSTSEVRRAENGTLHSRQYYRAFGEERYTSGTLPTDRTYTGQRKIENGLVHYGARIYDPMLARFVQADTIIPQPGNPMAWDRYEYVNNDPVNGNDPTGHKACEDSFDGCGSNPGVATQYHLSILYWATLHMIPIPTIQVLPVNAYGVQWFGPSQRAYDLMSKDDNIYQYCGYYHCGLDLLADYGSPVVSGTYGRVVYAGRTDFEGPYSITIEYGDYTIKYGHTNGVFYVNKGDYVAPGQLISEVGNMGGSKDSTEVNHIHLEVRGPGGWAGQSINPVSLMPLTLITNLQEVASAQTHEVTMGRYHSSFNPPDMLMKLGIQNIYPRTILRGTGDNYFK